MGLAARMQVNAQSLYRTPVLLSSTGLDRSEMGDSEPGGQEKQKVCTNRRAGLDRAAAICRQLPRSNRPGVASLLEPEATQSVDMG
jgi:hypothetical protein